MSTFRVNPKGCPPGLRPALLLDGTCRCARLQKLDSGKVVLYVPHEARG